MRAELCKVFRCTLAELGERIDADEFAHWRVIDRLSPLDTAWRFEVAVSILAAQVATTGGVKGASPEDYRVDWGRPWRRAVEAEKGLDLDYLENVMRKLGGG